MPCRFGAALRRLFNWIVTARRKYPNRKIVMSKVDFRSAFRRAHLHPETAVQTITQLPEEDLALLSLRLPFGGAACPAEWGVISETICDLANAILQENDWDPKEIYSPNSNLVPTAKLLSEDIPYAQGKELAVEIPVDPRGKNEVFVDDNLTVGVLLPKSDPETPIEMDDCTLRLERAVLLAIYITARPQHKDEPIPRDWMEAINKLVAEAGLEEIKLALGWQINLRLLLVSLPVNKAIAWDTDIRCLLKNGEKQPKC